MKHIFMGLGNPGMDYEMTRHNTGRLVLETIAGKQGFSEWEVDKNLKSLVSEGESGKADIIFVMPETFMNKSGFAAKKLAPSIKKANKLVVVYDEIDLPIGTFKISYGRGDAGHNGLKSIIRALGTKDFVRIRVGVSPKVRGSNNARKPKGENKVLDFLLGKFRKQEEVVITSLSSDIYKAMQTIIESGHERAMNEFN